MPVLVPEMIDDIYIYDISIYDSIYRKFRERQTPELKSQCITLGTLFPNLSIFQFIFQIH